MNEKKEGTVPSLLLFSFYLSLLDETSRQTEKTLLEKGYHF